MYLLRASVGALRFRLHSVQIASGASTGTGSYARGDAVWVDDDSMDSPIGLKYEWSFLHGTGLMMLDDLFSIQSNARFLDADFSPLTNLESVKVFSHLLYSLDWYDRVAIAAGLKTRRDFK